MPGMAAALTAVLFLPPIAKGQIISEGPELDAAKSLIVMIECNLNGVATQGAGIVVAMKDGWTYIVTAYHVVRKGDDARAKNLKIRFWQSQRETLPAEEYHAKYQDDLAVLRVKAPQAAFPFKRLADPDQLKKSQLVYAIGYPSEEGPWGVTYLPGAIADITTLHLKVESPTIQQGYSGGALIDEHKMLVGMVLNTDGTTARALRIDAVAEILRRDLGLQVELSTGTADRSKSVMVAPSPVRPVNPLPLGQIETVTLHTVNERTAVDRNFDGTFDEIYVDPQTRLVHVRKTDVNQLFANGPGEFRGALTFELVGIPRSAIVDSAVLSLSVWEVLDPRVELYGFVGSPNLDIGSEAFVGGTKLIGPIPFLGTQAFKDALNSLDVTEYVQSAITRGFPNVGFSVREVGPFQKGVAFGTGFTFTASDFPPTVGGDARPHLTLRIHQVGK
jgi:hypothetical protein